MVTYKIKYYYRTGDSFGHEDLESELPERWSNLEQAKIALQRIKEHYEWYESKNDSYSWKPKNLSEPEWHKGIEYDFCLKLPNDSGVEFQMHAPWCGYFERLHSAEIVASPDDSGMRIEF